VIEDIGYGDLEFDDIVSLGSWNYFPQSAIAASGYVYQQAVSLDGVFTFTRR